MTQFGRVITAMITPFKEDGSVDYENAAALAKHLIQHGLGRHPCGRHHRGRRHHEQGRKATSYTKQLSTQ